MMRQNLGETGISVSKLCFGSLTMGPLQRHLSPAEGAALIQYAYERGVNFIDTAELYETYAHIKEALKNIPRDDFVIASKCYAYSENMARDSLEKALKELGTDYIDVFLLHEQMNALTFKGHYEAVEYFLKAKSEGKIRAFGISTHYVEGVKAALKFPEIEIIHPIINVTGLGIQDGSVADMVEVLKQFKQNGGGIFGMKPLGGGNLLKSIDSCFEFILEQTYLDSIAFGMQSIEEIDYNVKRLQGDFIEEGLKSKLSQNTKELSIADWCTCCGACVQKCDHKALRLANEEIIVNREKCVLCGYCAAVCPEFCIKVY